MLSCRSWNTRDRMVQFLDCITVVLSLLYHSHWITVVLSPIPLTQVATSWHDVTPTLGPRHLHLGSDISLTDTELCRSHGLAQVWTTSTALYPRVVGPSLPSAVGLGHHTVDLRPSPTLRLSYTVDVRTTLPTIDTDSWKYIKHTNTTVILLLHRYATITLVEYKYNTNNVPRYTTITTCEYGETYYFAYTILVNSST